MVFTFHKVDFSIKCKFMAGFFNTINIFVFAFSKHPETLKWILFTAVMAYYDLPKLDANPFETLPSLTIFLGSSMTAIRCCSNIF